MCTRQPRLVNNVRIEKLGTLTNYVDAITCVTEKQHMSCKLYKQIILYF